MPQFTYRAKDTQLNVIEGTIEADNEASAIGRLGSQGVFPISIIEAGSRSPSRAIFAARRVSSRTLAYTTRQLADLLGGGLPLFSALTLLAKQTEHRTLKGVIEALTNAVREGRALSDALTDHPKVFPPLYVSLVRAGEVGGALEKSLVRLAELGEHEADLRSRVNSAMAYPLFVLALAAAMTVFLLSYVIPTLSLVFVESGQLLPLPTRVLLRVSDFFTHWWWALAAGVLALGWFIRQQYASPSGRALLDRAVIELPGVGTLVRKLETARLARNLGTLIGQGVPVLQAIDIVAQSVLNSVLQRAVEQARVAVGEGSSIAAAIGASGQFPIFVSNMIAVGEESGTVDEGLLKVASAYEREVDRAVGTLTTLLEPVLLVGVGGVVMFMVLAMLLPIFQIGLVVQ